MYVALKELGKLATFGVYGDFREPAWFLVLTMIVLYLAQPLFEPTVGGKVVDETQVISKTNLNHKSAVVLSVFFDSLNNSYNTHTNHCYIPHPTKDGSQTLWLCHVLFPCPGHDPREGLTV